MQRTLGLLAGALAAVLLAGCGNATPIGSTSTATPSPFPPQVTSEFPIPTSASQPTGIVKGPDGSLWFTETAGDKIGKLPQSASPTITDYALPRAAAAPRSITVGPDGALWFTESTQPYIGRLVISSLAFTEIGLGLGGTVNTSARPWGIVTAPTGAMWITDPGTNSIWQISTAGVPIANYPITTPNANPTSITVGPDSAIWFVEANVDRIGKLLPSAANGTSPTEYQVTAGAGLGTIISGSDNALWFTESTAKKVGRMLTNGTVSSETALTGTQSPVGIVLGGDGNFYITDQGGSQICMFSPSSGAIKLYPTKTASAQPYGVTLGPDNEVYFTEQTGNTVGQFRYF